MTIYILVLGIIIAASIGLLVGIEAYKKNIHIWFWSYFKGNRPDCDNDKVVHIIFAFCDHFEPRWGKVDYATEVSRVDRWCADYPKLASKHLDADGCHPKHSFFYPEEEYGKEHISKISAICKEGFGEIEIHLHHDNDTANGLTKTISGFLTDLDFNHNVVAKSKENDKFQFAFIHGNWALDNSRKDGRCCGVDNELSVLKELGCYADYTLPSAPSDTQTSTVNSIYYAKGVNGVSKSHDKGVEVEVGKPPSGDLMIIQGPLCFNWHDRKFGILPRIENSDIRVNSPPSKDRVDMWVNCGIHVKGKPEWRYIKIHTHGTQECDMDTLLGEPVDSMFTYLEEKYNDGDKYALHYVSAREMFNIIKAAEAGETGNPGQYRDYNVPRPAYLNSAE